MKKLLLALLALGMLLAGNCSRPVVPPQPVTLDGSVPVLADAAPPLLDAAPAPAPTPTVVADAAPPPAPDAGPVPVPLTPVGAACFNLAAIKCSDGEAPSCVATLQHVVDFQAANHGKPPPLACLTGAKDTKAAKACGLVSCK